MQGSEWKWIPLNLPDAEAVEGIDEELGYYFVGDDIFPLKPYLMRPYAGGAL